MNNEPIVFQIESKHYDKIIFDLVISIYARQEVLEELLLEILSSDRGQTIENLHKRAAKLYEDRSVNIKTNLLSSYVKTDVSGFFGKD